MQGCDGEGITLLNIMVLYFSESLELDFCDAVYPKIIAAGLLYFKGE